MFWYNKTLVEFDLVQHQISVAGSRDVRLSFASPNITCPGKTNLMLDSVSSNKCLVFVKQCLPLSPRLRMVMFYFYPADLSFSY